MLLLIVVVFAACLFGATANQPFHLDNMDFPAAAIATSTTGLPIYYRGEDNPRHLGLYHPPLFIYLLAAWIRLAGFDEVSVRMFGFACALLQAVVVIAILQTLLGRKSAVAIAPWFLVVYFLNPYTLQTASIVDIDSTIYGPLLCGIVLFTLRMSWRDGVRRTDEVTLTEFTVVWVLIVLALWAKLTTVLLLLGILPLFLVARFGWRKAISLGAILIAAGVAGFALSYWAYGVFTGLDVSYTVRFTIDSFLNRGSSGRTGVLARIADKFATFAVMAPIHIRWTSYFPWIVSGAACLLSVWHAVRRKSVLHAHIALVMGLALITTAYYCGQTLTFGRAPFKYTFVYWALILSAPAFISYSLYGTVELFERKAAVVVSASAFVLSLYISIYYIHDEIIQNVLSGGYVRMWNAPAVVAVVAIACAARWRNVSRIGIVTSMAMFTGLSCGVALHQARAPYSTTYDYGQLGFTDTVGFIRANTAPEATIVSMKDIGFATGRRYFENFDAVHGASDKAPRLQEFVASGRAEYVIFTEGHGQDQLIANPAMKEWAEVNLTLVRSIGHYRIYQLKKPNDGQVRYGTKVSVPQSPKM
jgi:hypothetical protein